MGAIVAYTNDLNEDKARRDGLAILGQLLIAKTGSGAADKAEGLRLALQEAKTFAQLDLRYQSNSINPLAPKGYIIKVPASVTGNKIVCDLTNDKGDDVGKLTLTPLRNPGKDPNPSGNPKNDNYHMNVIFPESADDTGFPYLNQVAIDALDIEKGGGTITNVKNYLAAFKFLSRCK